MQRHLTAPDHLDTFLSVKINAEQWLIDSLADYRSVHGAMRLRERERVRAAVRDLRNARARYQDRWALFIREYHSKKSV